MVMVGVGLGLIVTGIESVILHTVTWTYTVIEPGPCQNTETAFEPWPVTILPSGTTEPPGVLTIDH